MGCDIHLYVEQRNVDGSWSVVSGVNPRIAMYREWAERDRERGEIEKAERLEETAAAIESGAKAQYEPDEYGYVSEYENPTVHADWVYDGRNYDLFAILANVRNGRGFAGCPTGLGFKPISEPKGLPSDVSEYVKAASDRWDCDGHSRSWHTVSDLLAYDWEQITFEYGVVSEDEYRVFKEKGRPESWAGAVMGRDIQHVDTDAMDRILAGSHPKQVAVEYYTRIQWMVTYKEAAGSFYTDSLPKLQALAGGDPTSVRIVFWFDN